MIVGIPFTEQETGHLISCGICGRKANIGFYLSSTNDDEIKFLEKKFMGLQNATVGMSCCKDEFRQECRKEGYDVKYSEEPLDEEASEMLDGEITPHKVFRNVLEGEYHIIRTKKDETFYGLLFDYNESECELINCLKEDIEGEWKRVGSIEIGSKHVVRIQADDIISIEFTKTRLFNTDKDDHGFTSIIDKPKDRSWDI